MLSSSVASLVIATNAPSARVISKSQEPWTASKAGGFSKASPVNPGGNADISALATSIGALGLPSRFKFTSTVTLGKGDEPISGVSVKVRLDSPLPNRPGPKILVPPGDAPLSGAMTIIFGGGGSSIS